MTFVCFPCSIQSAPLAFTARTASIPAGTAGRASRASRLLDAARGAVRLTGRDPTVTRVSGCLG